MVFRKETDSLGEVNVPDDKYFGAQTQRSMENFNIGNEKIPIEVIRALVWIKRAAALSNNSLGLLSEDKLKAITHSCQKILDGNFDDNFPLSVWQTGSGTQTNMNVNEVISNMAIEYMGGTLGTKIPVHPNDDVNKSQSSNDTFPTAMHISTCLLIKNLLMPSLVKFYQNLKKKSENFKDIIKIGRTHLMDATPITLGQEFSGYAAQIESSIDGIKSTMEKMKALPLGGTAVGTGINSPQGFAEKAISLLAEFLDVNFYPIKNRFQALSSHDVMVEISGMLKVCACSTMKIVNDIRWSASGPRCGIGELILPANEPGSSIMPGKVNPTQCEAVAMICSQVIGNDASIAVAGCQGHFQLNTFKPVIIFNVIQSIKLLADGINSFVDKCLEGIIPNKNVINENLNNSLMLATILNTELGYDKASTIVKKAHQENISLKKSAVALKMLSEKEFDKIVDPKKMI